MPYRTDLPAVKSRLRVINLGILLGFIAVAMLLSFWSVVRGPTMATRDDNPRFVDASINTIRGRILDRNGFILAATIVDDSVIKRTYASEGAGPAVGYYSFRYGTSGIENGLDGVLSGKGEDFWQSFWDSTLLHRPTRGRDVKSTLDHQMQEELDDLMKGANGGATLFSVPSFEILALSSQPGYDPNSLESRFEDLVDSEEAPLLNRVTQGQYQPGQIIQPFVVAKLNESEIDLYSDTITEANTPVIIGDAVLVCAEPVSEFAATWAEIVAQQCPGPLKQVGSRIGSQTIAELLRDMRFFQQDDLITETEMVEVAAIKDPSIALLGYDTQVISPLRIASLLVSLANGGRQPRPQLIIAIQDTDGNWRSYETKNGDEIQIFSVEAARIVLNSMLRDEDVIQQSSLVDSGSKRTSNAWYMGLYPARDPQYGIVIVLENQDDLANVERIGRLMFNMLAETEG